MCRVGSIAVVVAGLLAVGLVAPAGAQKLDDEDKAFLRGVQPIILVAEKATYEKLKDKEDRLEFQKIFWARRDPDPGAPVSAFREQYLKDRAVADDSYRVGPTLGSATDCGRTFILLGRPDEVEARHGQAPVASEGGVRVPETWIYRDRPDRPIQNLKVAIPFDSECRADGGFAQQFPRIAANKIIHSEIDYKVGADGHLVKLADQLPSDSQTRALLREPRQDFALSFQPAYLKTASGGTALLGLVEGDAAGLAAAAGGAGTVEVSVGARAESSDGQTAGWTVQTVKAPVTAGGRFLASFKLGLKPGRYKLQAGVLDPKGNKGSVASAPIDVPSFSQVATGADGSAKAQLSGTVLILKDIKETAPNAPADATDPFAAFVLNTTRLVPVFASSLHRSDSVVFFFQVYDLQVDPATGKAKGSVRLKLAREGAGLLHESAPTAIETGVFTTAAGPIALTGFPPGKYVVQVESTDAIAQKTATAQASFEILP